MVQNDKKFCHAQYLRNHTSYDCHLWYTCAPGIFFIFSKFGFFRFLGGKRARGKNGPKWQKILLHLVSQEPYIIWLLFMSHLCKMIWLSFMSHLCKMIWLSLMSHLCKIIWLSFMSHLCKMIWLSFMSHLRKMIISRGGFLIFSKFWCSGILWG